MEIFRTKNKLVKGYPGCSVTRDRRGGGMESRTVKPQNQLPNILRPSMSRHVSVIDYFKIARTPEILSIYPFCKQL